MRNKMDEMARCVAVAQRNEDARPQVALTALDRAMRCGPGKAERNIIRASMERLGKRALAMRGWERGWTDARPGKASWEAPRQVRVVVVVANGLGFVRDALRHSPYSPRAMTSWG